MLMPWSFPRWISRTAWAVSVAGALPLLLSCGAPQSERIPAIQAAPPAGIEPEPVEAGVVPPPGRYAPGVDPKHYEIELALPDTGTTFQGRAEIDFALAASAPDSLFFDLTGLAVERVRHRGGDVPFRLDGGRIWIDVDALREAEDPGDADSPRNAGRSAGSSAGTTDMRIGILYRGTPDDGLILRETVHGAPAAFADNWPDRARFWFPSLDHPSLKATVSFTVHAPERWQVIANGALLEDPFPTPADALGGGEGKRTWKWATRAPIPTYTMIVGATDFVTGDTGLAACRLAMRSPRDDGCIETSFQVFPPDSAHAAVVFRRTAEMVDYYSGLVGPFPYEKLVNVQSATRFGGMENASAIFYSEQSLAEGRDIEGTVAHEVAHQWFGDGVTQSDWHHLWLSEGFATYFGALFFEEADGVERFREILEGAREAYTSSDVTDRAVVDPGAEDLFDLLNANSYQKGGWVLHMLRGVMGDEAFFQGIRTYYGRHADGNALTEDLQAIMEESAAADSLRHPPEGADDEGLEWFFHQWLHEPGYPDYAAEWSWDAARQEVEVRVMQRQLDAWPTFRMPVTLAFGTGASEEDGAGEVRRTVWVERRSETFRIPLEERPTFLELDPDGWLLKAMPVAVDGTGGTSE